MLGVLGRIWAALTILFRYKSIVKEVQEAIEAYKNAMLDEHISKEEAVEIAEESLDVVYTAIPMLKDLIGVFKGK